MALPSVLHHVDLKLANVDRGVDQALALKVARHPSETMERVWLRILALAWQWEEGIAFGPGLSEPDAPDLQASRPDGTPSLLLRVGRPDVERVARDLARGAGARVAVLFDAPRWMSAFVADAEARRLDRLARAELAAVDPPLLAALSRRDDRRCRCELTLVGDHLYLALGAEHLDGPLHRGSVQAGQGRG
ncbi:MAG TPA: YaeQ family protein [Anaeromyxobacter sp.]|nr:YaeQ family protein [Anaeromyxobacter sp.]